MKLCKASSDYRPQSETIECSNSLSNGNTSLSLKSHEITECTAYIYMFVNLRSVRIIFFTIAFNVAICLMAIVGNVLILVALQSDSHLFQHQGCYFALWHQLIFALVLFLNLALESSYFR